MNYFFKKNEKQLNSKRGQAILIVVIMCTSIFLTIVLGVVDPVTNELRLSNDLLRSKASLYVAESSTEDAVYRVKHNMITNYAVPISINIDNYSATTSFSGNSGVQTINTTGSDNSNFRKIETHIVSGVGVDFFYGVQAGTGGFNLSGGSQINGNVYSNGSVIATNGVTITGSVVAANKDSSTMSTVGSGSYIGALNVGKNGVGDVWAHNVAGVSAQGTIYCQTSSKINKVACDTSRADPPIQDFAITDADMQTWKDTAAAGTIHVGNYHVNSTGATIGPMEITGNLLVDGGGTLTLTGTVWVQGNVTFSNGGRMVLAPGYGVGGGVLITDGLVSLSGGGTFSGSGTAGSFPLVITTNNSANAMNVSNGAGAVVLVAQSGTLTFSGGTSAQALSAKQIIVDGGGTVTYYSGLANYNFSSGPSGGWNISSWKEVQ